MWQERAEDREEGVTMHDFWKAGFIINITTIIWILWFVSIGILYQPNFVLLALLYLTVCSFGLLFTSK